ncbi:glucose 1-dehydrogenase [Methylophaga thalassica]|uniref:glucose 1-dehydrogenase n=1 Tax=Methylophaga aminisulfidivorans TaxID=230105 RepID=UPI003A90F779
MNKTVIITGGSRGIGAATSRVLAKQGYNVCINFINNEAAASQLCDEIKQGGGRAMIFKADVSIEADVESLFGAANAEFGTVTHLVNNVGILFEKTDFTQITAERFMKVMNTNVLSAFLCSKAFVRQKNKEGAIVNVSSAASRTGSPFEYVDYASSKGAMDSLTKGLSIELAAKNIRVNCVRPGFIETDIHADGGEPDRVKRLSSQIPLQRGGKPEEVANAIAWLLSDEASYATGSFVDIAGGR